MAKNVRKSAPKRLPYEVIEPLYVGGYSTQDIAAIVGTSPGSISRGIKGRVDRGTSDYVKAIRKRGVKTNRHAPVEISQKFPDFTDDMKELGYYARFKKYYNEVSMIQKASFIKDIKAVDLERTYEDIGKQFGISRSSITRLNQRVNGIWLKAYQEALGVLEEDKGLDIRLKKEAELLRKLYYNARTAFTFDAKRDRQYVEVEYTDFER